MQGAAWLRYIPMLEEVFNGAIVDQEKRGKDKKNRCRFRSGIRDLHVGQSTATNHSLIVDDAVYICKLSLAHSASNATGVAQPLVMLLAA